MSRIYIEDVKELIKKAGDVRQTLAMACFRNPGIHIGGPFSAVDIATAVYFKHLDYDPCKLDDPNRNIFILSKGHNGILFYSIYVNMGVYKPEELFNGYNNYNGPFGPHPNHHTVKGIEVSTGSLGHGINWAVGFSMARQDMGVKARTYVLLGDGEMEEGSNWEGILYAASKHMDDIVALVDFNHASASFYTNENMRWGDKGGPEGMAECYRAFGWNAMVIDGTDMTAIDKALSSLPEVTYKGKPTAIICSTTKGQGVKFMMDRPTAWHMGGFDDVTLKKAQEEIAEYTAKKLAEVE